MEANVLVSVHRGLLSITHGLIAIAFEKQYNLCSGFGITVTIRDGDGLSLKLVGYCVGGKT